MVDVAQMDIDSKWSYKELAAQFAKARASKEQEETSSEQAKQVKHGKELQFKASHGLLVTFLLWIWFVSAA